MTHPASGLEDDLRIMRQVALEGGRLALSYLNRDVSRVWEKTPGHPVTDADLAVDALLSDRLRAARPDYGWLSEETVDDLAGRMRQRIWVVDPIDGTRAFVRGDPNWCIGIAVVEDGIPVASVVYAPVFNELFYARIGGGCYLNGKSISASAQLGEVGMRIITNPSMIAHPDWPEPWPQLTVADPKPNATLYRMALVAAGRWDAALVLFRKSDWDLASGALLVSEAGGVATTHVGENFEFNRTVPAQRSMVAAGKALHPLLVRRVEQVRLPDPNGGEGLKP
ncbi:MAG: 3'(2'),5'-bisphosphate nucleotidase CysQ [Pseudomonadota bacterium]